MGFSLRFLGMKAGLNAEQWASWVQAVGSISAILISVGLASHQIDRQKTIEEARSAAESARVATFAKHVTLEAIAAISAVQRSQASWPQGTDYVFYEQPRVSAAMTMLQTAAAQPLSIALIAPVMKAHSILVEVESAASHLTRAGAYLANSRYALFWEMREREIADVIRQVEKAVTDAQDEADYRIRVSRHF